jgi:eukaryotic-like serine/threonine-protein kinase
MSLLMAPATLGKHTYQRLNQAFDALCQLPADQRRLDVLDLPESARDLLEKMLAAHDQAEPGMLDHTLSVLAEQALGPIPEIDCIGRRFGPWEVIEEIGRGGMGRVFRARRADGRFDKEVALKLRLRPDHGAGPERMQEEVRILARLEHAHVARLIDGGVSESGVAYQVMELVHGMPIDQYCNHHRLDRLERVRLFEQVVEAVAFAHRHLIVHSDIKPANVLVNEEGQVKLVDFGIASLLRQDSEVQLPGLFCSPAWCAPEQLQGEPPSVAQDIFALGALLYQLLSGCPIRDAAQVTRLAFGSGTPLPPPPLIERMAGPDHDLVAITQCALADAPDERYRSAGELLADLKNWRLHRPVTARSGGRTYVLARWLRRHRLSASAGALAALALVTGTSLALWQAHEARQAQWAAERELARSGELHEFVLSLFEGARLGQPRDQVPTTRDLLMQGAERARDRFAEQPELKAEMLARIGALLRNVGLVEEGRELLAESLSLQHELLDRDDARLLQGRLDHALALHYGGAIDEAVAQLNLLVDELRISGPDDLLIHALHAKGFALSEKMLFEQALRAHDEALQKQGTESDTPDPLALGEGLAAKARTLQRAGQLEESAELYDRAIALLAESGGTATLAKVAAMSDYGVTLRRLQRYREAEALLRRAIEASHGLYSGPHSSLAQRYNNLGSVLAGVGDRVGAVEAFEQALEILTALGDEAPGQVLAGPLNNLGFLNLSIGRFETAEQQLRQSLDLLEAGPGRNSGPHIAVSHNLGRCLMEMGRYESARDILFDAHQRATQAFPAEDDRVMNLASALAMLDWKQHHDPGALDRLEIIHQQAVKHRGADHPATARHALALADALLADGQHSEAGPLYLQSMQASHHHLGPSHPQTLAAHIGLAEVHQLAAEHAALAELLAELPADLQLAATDPLHARLARLQSN